MRNVLLCLFLSCLFSFQIAAQYEYNYTTYTIEEGLPSNKIYDIIEDKDGFIWFATDRGVAKYDGYDFKLFTTLEGLPNNDVWSLFEDSQGRIFLNTFYEGIVYIKEDKVNVIKNTFTKRWVNRDGYFEGNGTVYLRNQYHLFSFKEKVKVIGILKGGGPPMNNGLIYQNDSITLSLDYNNHYKKGRTNTMSPAPYLIKYISGQEVKKIPLTNDNENIICPQTDPQRLIDDKLYYWNSKGIFQYNINKRAFKFNPYKNFIDTSIKNVNELIFLGKRTWKYKNTLYYFDKNLELADKLVLKNIEIGRKALRDKEGNWWMVSPKKGVICLNLQSRENLQINLKQSDVSHIMVDEAGRIFYVNVQQFNPRRNDKLFFIEDEKNYPIHFGQDTMSIAKPIFLKDKLFISNYQHSHFNFAFLDKNEITNNKRSVLTPKEVRMNRPKKLRQSHKKLRDKICYFVKRKWKSILF